MARRLRRMERDLTAAIDLAQRRLHRSNPGTGLDSNTASAKANQVEPVAYVRNLLVQSSRHAPPPVTTLLPDAWLPTHPDSHRCWSR